MGFQQAEGWHPWKRSTRLRRQALRRAVVSVPWRDRLASLLVLLLTATGLLVTPTFGDSREEIHGYGYHRMSEGLKRLVECTSALERPLDSVLKCQAEAYRIFEEGLQWCMRNPESCRGIEEPPKAPELATGDSRPVNCPDGYVVDSKGNCDIQCNSSKFRACLATVTREFEAYLDQVCRGRSPADDFLEGIGINEGRFFAGAGLEAARIGFATRKWMADPTATSGELKRITGGSFARGHIYLFLLTSSWDTYKLVTSYPEWHKNFDQCHDVADKLRSLEGDACAREAGCWPHR